MKLVIRNDWTIYTPLEEVVSVKRLGRVKLLETKRELMKILFKFKRLTYNLDTSENLNLLELVHLKANKIMNCNKLEAYIKKIDELLEVEEKMKYSPEKILYVHKGNNIICKREHHDIVCVNAIVKTYDNKTVKLNVNYCINCDKFFISKAEYDAYIKKYECILANFEFVNEKFESDCSERKEYSKLRLNGYNVKENGPSEFIRHFILKYIMQHNIMGKYEIIDHLEYLIRTNGQRWGMFDAVEKWETDLDYVREYDIENQDTFVIDHVEKYRK